MNMTINSRVFGQKFNFYMPDSGGYVWLEDQQICENGSLLGPTIRATPATFRDVCRTWYRAHYRKNREMV